ncbi:MAG: EAL domain-containing protein [Gammaproteobacteria bacterium]|nr:EAL domain-containing protein [Gammaproteobacteria bacterium]
MVFTAGFGPEFAQHLLDAAPVVLFATDHEGVITISKGRALTPLGLEEDELVGQSVFSLYPDEPRIADAATRALQGETVVVELALDGKTHSTQFAPLNGLDGTIEGIVGVATDITSQVEAQRAFERLAHFDSLTGLPNRNGLHQYVDMATSATPLTPFAVAIIGLDRFREVNHTFGYETGDHAIKEIANRFMTQFQESAGGFCARAAGDEFGVVVSGTDARTLRDTVHQRVDQIFQDPVIVREQPLTIEARTGIAFFPGHGEESDKLIRRADTAMHRAKDGGSTHAVYDRHRDEPKINNIQLVADLRGAIQAGEVELYYQPQIDLTTGRMTAAEVLCRWARLKDYGIHIGELLRVAERSGVIYLLDEWIMNQAIKNYSMLARKGQRLPVAVNVSARTFQRPKFAQEVAGLIDIWGVPPADLCVEITETAMVHDHGQLQRTCDELRKTGIGVAIDDFGTGNSSLVYLKDLGVTVIKIDLVFVIGLAKDKTAQTLVQSIIDMGNNLDVRVIAEGVEDEEVLDLLQSMGCHEAQGFHIGHPMPLSQLVDQITN